MSCTEIYNQTYIGFYQIKVQGELSHNVMEYFGGMKIEMVQDKSGMIETVLSGMLEDQGALIGILNMLYDFQYFIYSVQYMGDGKTT